MILGIDPGLNGALALLSGGGVILTVHDMPLTPKTGKGGNQVDAGNLCVLLRTLAVNYNNGAPIRTYVERVGAMPGQGVTSMFSFGEGCGVLRGVLSAREFPLSYVAPVKWKNAVGLKGFDKRYALTVAKQLVPSSAVYLTKNKHVGRADATLIAYYGAQQS